MCSFLALEGYDFVKVYQELFLNGDSPNPYSIYIPIKNDECVEDDENFFVYIYADSDCVELDDYNSSITILDDDGTTTFLVPQCFS